MTVEQIEKQIDELKKKKKEELKKQQQKKLKEQREINAKKRKLESRVKYIIGGHILSVDKEKDFYYVKKIVSEKSAEMRPADLDTLNKYLDLQKTTN